MIQEKDFLYRVPVKNVLVTTPRQQVRNPEILVDLEGGEFMHGNILDANSTNKLINQSVKDAVDNKLIESGYVTQDLLDAETTRATEQENSLKTLIGAETSARTKGDEDLSAKIKAEQTRAEGKEKEISDKLAIVDGDSNTEGSFRKAIADVIAAAPEDLDTLKEIADKLADNDDLHTALNQAITDKADASALLNEVTRATGAESALQTAIDTKADAAALSNYVLTAALNKQIDTLNTAISAKQDAGNYIPYDASDTSAYKTDKEIKVSNASQYTTIIGTDAIANFQNGQESPSFLINDGRVEGHYQYMSYSLSGSEGVHIINSYDDVRLSSGILSAIKTNNGENKNIFEINKTHFKIGDETNESFVVEINANGVRLLNGDTHHVLTSDASTIDITQYALKSQLDTKADNLELAALEQNVMNNSRNIEGKQDKGNYMEYSSKNDDGYTVHWKLTSSEPITVEDGNGLQTQATYSGITVSETGTKISSQLASSSLTITRGSASRTKYTVDGITSNQYNDCLATSDGTFKPISDFVLKTDAGKEYVAPDDLLNELNGVNADITSIRREMDDKQDKIKANSVDVQNLDRANIDQLIAIVKELLIALDSSGLIIMEDSVE